MKSELKDCPFCGKAPIIQEIEAHQHHMKLGDFTMPDHPGCFTLECSTPGCCAMIADTKAELITAWERRAIAPPVAAGSVDIDVGDPFLCVLQTYGLNFGKPMDAPHRTNLIANINAWGAQQREAGRVEQTAFLKECMDRGQAEFNRKWTEQKERAEKAEADVLYLKKTYAGLFDERTTLEQRAEKAEAELKQVKANHDFVVSRNRALKEFADSTQAAFGVLLKKHRELQAALEASKPYDLNA